MTNDEDMRTSHRVRMFDTDAAGVIFFGSQFRFFHEAIEALFDNIGYSFKALFSTSPFCFVVVHASSDFLQPLTLGDPLEIETELEGIGTTSLTLSFNLFREEELVGRGRIVQVCINASTRKKQPIPAEFMEEIKKAFP